MITKVSQMCPGKLNGVRTAPILSIDTVNPNLRAAEYAVRGAIPQRAEQLEKQLAADKADGKQSLPFTRTVGCNIGE